MARIRSFCLIYSICLFGANLSAFGDEEIDGDSLFDTSIVQEIKIEIGEGDWLELCSQSRNILVFLSGMKEENPYNYFPGTVWVNGRKIGNVGVRKKGLFGSQDGVRPSLKIKFDEYQQQDPVSGLNRITLNNNKQDTSQLSQILTYELFRKAGIKAPRASLAKVTVNGEFLGIYTHVESVKKPFLKRAFGNNKGDLYEGTVADFYPKALDSMEAKTNKKGKRKQITKLAEVLLEKELDMEELSNLVDLDHFIQFWVIEGLIRYWDGYSANQNNYFYYVNPEYNKGYFIPWGTDSSFLKNGGPFNSDQKLTCLYANGYLANRLFHQEGIAERYKRQMEKSLDDFWDEAELDARIDELSALLKGNLHPSQARAAGASIEQIKSFIEGRREAIQGELANWPPEIPASPRKPMYGVKVGKATGEFSAVWRDKRSRNPTKEGKAKFNLQIDGEVVEFIQVGVAVQEFKLPTFGQRQLNPDPPVDLVLAGERKEDGKRMTMSLYLDMEDYLSKKVGKFEASGMISEGRGGSFAAFRNSTTKSVNGTVTLSNSSNEVGQAVTGSFDLEVVEMRGGLFRR